MSVNAEPLASGVLCAGNCGVGIAPTRATEADREYMIGMLAAIEDIPAETLRAGSNILPLHDTSWICQWTASISIICQTLRHSNHSLKENSGTIDGFAIALNAGGRFDTAHKMQAHIRVVSRCAETHKMKLKHLETKTSKHK